MTNPLPTIGFPALPGLVGAVKKALDHNKEFALTQEQKVCAAKEQTLSGREAFKNIRDLASRAIELLGRNDLRLLDPSQRESLRDLVDVVYRASKAFEKKFGKTNPKRAKDLHDTALCAKLGGKITKKLFTKDFITFIEANALQHKIQALGYQLSKEPALPIEGIDQPVSWSKITKTPLTQTSPTDPAFSFSFEGQEIFRTDNQFKLHSDYTYIDGKIAKYNPMTFSEIRAYDHEKAVPGQFKIELWTAIKDVKAERPVLTIGDHAYLVLVNDEGSRIGVGQYGMVEETKFTDIFTVFGKKKGGVETPDRYLLMPKDSHSFQKTEFIVNKESFDKVMGKIQEHKTDENFSASLLCGNCSSMVEELLESIEIKINTKIHCLELFWRKFAPLSFVTAVDKMVDAWSNWVPKALTYLPIFYVPIVFYGILAKALSLKNFNNEPSDISLFDVFFFPWKVTIDHPFAVRRWQEEHPDSMDRVSPNIEPL